MTQSIYMYAGVYNLSLQAAQRGSGNSQDQSIQVLLDGAQIGLITPSSTNYYLYQTLNFTVTTGSHTVEFLGLAPSSADSTALIDLTATKAVNDSLSDGSFETPVLAANSYQVEPDSAPWLFSEHGRHQHQRELMISPPAMPTRPPALKSRSSRTPPR